MARSCLDLLVQYARYHRDQRNIATQFVGVPMIVFGMGVLLARARFDVAGFELTAAWLAVAAATVWYLTRRGALSLTMSVSAAMAGVVAASHAAAQGGLGSWLAWGLGSAVTGWTIRFLGHYYEGRKPAFADDLAGLLVGPLFITAEALFAAGWNKPLLKEIERRAGPTHLRDLIRAG